MKVISSIYLLFTTVLASSGGRCPPTGPTLPRPAVHSTFRLPDVVSKVNNLIGNNTVSWNTSTTSFSLEITTTEDTLLSFHHTASIRNENSTAQVSTNTIYRVASITKVFNTLLLLLHAEKHLDSPIGRFVPELQVAPQYGNITLRMLASHVAGIPRDSNPFDLYVSGGEGLEDAGFPKPDSADIPGCDVPGGQPCTKQDLLKMLVSEPLVWQAGDRAAYSSLSFILLGYALENITGKTFTDLLKESVSKPLGLSFTGLDPPVDLSQAIIPAGKGGFVMGYDIGNYNTTAGLYSTPGDISKFLRAIMANTLVSSLQTRQWLKPSIFAGSFSTAVGMPWEIFRLSNLTPDNRPIDLYTKSGGIFGYETNMVLIPEFNVGISVLAAGDDAGDALMGLLDIVIPATVSSLDQLARQQAKETYAGNYQSANGTDAILSLDVDDGPGLKITQWNNRGKSMLEFLASREGTNVMDLDMRLYPVGEGQRWRLVLERTERANPSVFSDACITWLRVDQMRYAKQPVDEFTFDITGGTIIGLKNSGLRAKLVKTS